MGELAWPGEASRLSPNLADWLNGEIAALEAKHPMRGFCLPGRSVASAQLDFCRAVCRRAERELVAFAREESLNPLIIIYVNRLSDLLYLAARDNETTPP
jgi:ATP:cob(I)alamin adenosyltransferase